MDDILSRVVVELAVWLVVTVLGRLVAARVTDSTERPGVVVGRSAIGEGA
ncbi:MAG TPA: hypothetical protein VE152_14605 [Acidimicrobiales bacterium]|nr:hypothetical protein [Acidimicrobiales bacterium]